MAALKNLRTAHKIAVAFTVMIAVIVVAMTVILVQIRNADDAQAESRDAVQLMSIVDEIEEAMIAQEKSVRGFVLTGNKDELKTYKKNKAEFEKTVNELRQATADDTEMAEMVETLAAAKSSWETDVADHRIELMRIPSKISQARAHVATDKGAAKTERIHEIFEEVNERANVRLERRNADKKAAFETTYTATIAGILTALSVAVVLGLVVS